MMKRLLFTLLALCVLCVGLQAQNTNTSNQKGVTVTGQLDTVRNTRMNPTTQNEQIQSKFVDQFGKTGQRPGLSPYGQRLKAVIKITSSSMVSNSVSATTATIAATVSDSGDYAIPIIERGVCYATTANPTLLTPTATKVTDNTISGKGFGNFNVSLSGLLPNTAYHARAYAVSMYDTVYGEDLTITTLIAGTLSGKFTINANGDQVYFSQGNLRATNTTANSTSGWTWSFAEHQYDYIGNNTANNKLGNNVVTTAGTVDLFGWVGSNSSFAAYGINNEVYDSYYGNVTSEPLKSDWGHNVITNGGNAPDLWRTLTKDEWVWIIGPNSNANPGTNCRTSSTVGGTANARFTYATINGTYKGLIIFPDLYTAGTPIGVTWGTINNINDNTTTCTTEGWTALEAVGCVFLPAAGVRGGNNIYDVASRGNYWSSTSHESDAAHAHSMHFYQNGINSEFNPANHWRRRDGYSIRLVHSTKNIGSLSYASTAVNKTTSDNTPFTNPLTHVGDGTVTYVRSAGDDICTVDATTGLVILKGTAGTCTITATVTDSPLYAYNKKTASYTLTVTFVGALPGKFTVNANGDQVNFSQGNLQYQASSNTWRFAEHQWNYVGDDSNGNVYENNVKCNNNNINSSYTGWIDLFGWGTGDNPTKSTQSNSDYNNFTAWGENAISNGGNTTDMWRTLTKNEWVYLFNSRTTTSGVRYAKATVNNVAGIILLPDDWSTSYYTLSATNTYNAAYTSNNITLSDWTSSLESHGAVFLPAAGSRGSTVGGASLWGDYWSSSPYSSNDAYYVYIYTDNLTLTTPTGRAGGRSVRLVSETPFLGAGTEEDPYLISSKADWNHLANKVNSGINYSGKYFRQTADINNVTSMVGVYSDPWKSPFRGTYDGDGNTLNLSINTNSSFAGPFQYIENSTVKNVITTGSVSVQNASNYHPAGLVGSTTGTCTIQNCLVSANVSGARHMGGIVGHCWTADISIIGCVYSGTLTPASEQWTGGILGWGGDGGGHTISISDCLFAGSFVYSISNTKFHPIGILQNQSNTKNLSNTYYTLGAINTTDNESFVRDLSYKGKFARSITGGPGVTVAKAGTATAVYDVSGITSYGTGILYDGVLYAGNGEAVSLTLSHAAAPSGTTFVQHTVTGGGTLNNPTSNTPTLTMTDANQVINAEYIPQGAINGKFTINASGDQVYFSQGNLQATYNGSTWSWAFATNQWDYIGGKSSGSVGTETGNNFINGDGTMSAAGTVDLFGWVGNSSTILTDAPAMYGISNSTTSSTYGTQTNEALKSDWGNTIGSGWRTLTGGSGGEWEYLFKTRSASTVNGTDNARFAKAHLFGTTYGIILFPDSYTHPDGIAAPTGINATDNTSWDANTYSAGDWAKMEAAGCVFLPVAGRRMGTEVNDTGKYGYGSYWSSSPYGTDANQARYVNFGSGSLNLTSFYWRTFGCSVRLVRNAN
jgi:hypothetical protein